MKSSRQSQRQQAAKKRVQDLASTMTPEERKQARTVFAQMVALKAKKMASVLPLAQQVIYNAKHQRQGNNGEQ